jgi:hypothetical protein
MSQKHKAPKDIRDCLHPAGCLQLEEVTVRPSHIESIALCMMCQAYVVLPVKFTLRPERP